ncbi:MAG: T9SS type A sorting domain-containing protein [Flavobacteriales bacterium]|nr:T9SS type A sorting domain-containing protein [Flavobacteriales bacterium]
MRFPFIFLAFIGINASAQLHFEPENSIGVHDSVKQLLSPWTGGLNAAQFNNIDLDQDGLMDLFVFDRDGEIVRTFLRNDTVGGINYTYAPQYEDSFPDDLKKFVLLADYNCDGHLDLFTQDISAIKLYKSERGTTGMLSFSLVTKKITYPTNFGPANIYCSNTDIPTIVDLDHDGDLDIISPPNAFSYISYYKNNSMELYGVCDSVDYTLGAECWGKFVELQNNTLSLDDPYCDNIWTEQGTSSAHAGTTLLAINLDGNDSTTANPNYDYDILMGDVSFRTVVSGINGLNKDTAFMTNQDLTFPSYDVPVDLMFPGAYYVDIDGDNTKDLVFSPSNNTAAYFQIQANALDPSDNVNNISYYKNIGKNDSCIASFVKKDFLVGEMIDVGSNSNPVLFDYNSDGKLDLLIGTHGYFNKANNSYDGRLTLYENIGSNIIPEFTYITDDYAGTSSLGITGLAPCFGDLDGDGDEDMIIGDEEGRVHYFENLAGALNPANFVLSAAIYSGIDVNDNAMPALFDINGDTLLDLIIGDNQGKLNYFPNTGTKSTPSFSNTPDDNFLGSVDVRDQFNIGYSAPVFINNNGNKGVYVGSYKGIIYYYENISDTANFILVDSLLINARRISPSIGKLFGQTFDGLVYGQSTGGVTLMKKDILNSFDSKYEGFDLKVWPNPARHEIFVRTAENEGQIDLINIHGQVVLTKNLTSQLSILNVDNLARGTYFVRQIGDRNVSVQKIVIE